MNRSQGKQGQWKNIRFQNEGIPVQLSTKDQNFWILFYICAQHLELDKKIEDVNYQGKMEFY